MQRARGLTPVWVFHADRGSQKIFSKQQSTAATGFWAVSVSEIHRGNCERTPDLQIDLVKLSNPADIVAPKNVVRGCHGCEKHQEGVASPLTGGRR
jgi:hypothetical protein